MAKRNSLARDQRLPPEESATTPTSSASRAAVPRRTASGKAAGAATGLSPKSTSTPLSPVDGEGGDATPASLDRLIHERIRLGIVSALAVNAHLSFNALKALMGTTDGNLSVHARKLEEAGYVSCTKSFEGRVPKTDYALTATGRRALERYLAHMEAIIKATRER
ncbi:MAG: transcriptional regulator [Gemmatimonadaceae bacterium]